MKRLFRFFFLLFFVGFQPVLAQEFRVPEVQIDRQRELITPDGWVNQVGKYVRIHGPASQVLAMERLLKHAEASTPRLASMLRLPTGRRIEIYLTDSQKQFRDLQPGNPPGWADATAYPRLAWVFLRKNALRGGMAAKDTQVLDHELVHILLGQAFQERSPPRWLQEGVAQWYSGEYNFETIRRIADGTIRGGLFELEELAGRFPQHALRADLAYAQSADFIAWLVGRYGEGVLSTLVRQSIRGASFEEALFAATGRTIDELDQAWGSRPGRSWLWVKAIANDGVLLGLAGGILVFGYVRVRRRNRQRLAEMARQDELEDRLAALLFKQKALQDAPVDLDQEAPTNGNPWIH